MKKSKKTKRNKGRQLSTHHIHFNMAAKMLLTQQRCYSDTNSKNSFKFSEKSRSIKIISDLKYQDKKTVSYLDDFTPVEPVEQNAKNLASLNLLDKTMSSRPVSHEKIGRFRNAKLETRYRTNSTDSAFSEESFVDLESDESTKLESLIDQLIFTDDRLKSGMSSYVKTEKQPSTDTGILDVGDLFNNADIFTVDFESLAHETQTSNFLERETRPDSENAESISSISSSDSGKDSVHKYPAKMSAFLECNHDKDLNANDNDSKSERFTKFSSSFFISSDQEDVNDVDGSVVNKPNVSSSIAYGTVRSDGCVNDCVHESSFVDLSTLLDVTPYGSPFSVGDHFPIDSQRHLNADDTDASIIDSNNSKTDTYAHVNTAPHQVASTTSTLSASHAITTKSKNNSNQSENGVQLTDVHFWPMKEDNKMAMPVPLIKNCPAKCMDISEENFSKIVDESINGCDEHSQESLYLCSLENLCGYGDQELSGINQNNQNCNFLSDTYHEPEHRFIFKSSDQTSDSTDRQKFMSSSEDKSSEIKFPNQKDSKEGLDDSKGFNDTKLLNINDSVVHFGDKLDTVKLESYFTDVKDVDVANSSKVQSSSPDVWMLSNDDHIKGMISKDHSYRANIPVDNKERNMPVIDERERNNKTNQMTGLSVKQSATKRPLVKDLKSDKQELSLSEENLSNSACSSSNTVFPGLKFLLEEESESVLHRSTNNNYYTFARSDDSGCIQSKVPKFSVIDNDETRVQSAILYQVLSMEQQPPLASFSSTPFLPVKSKVKNNHYSKSTNSRNFKGHYLTNIRQGAMSMRMKEESSEMKELEKYLRGIIPTENYNDQDETFADHQRKTSELFFRQDRSPCSFLKKLLTGEMTAQMYRKIDQQFCENEQLIKNEVKMD